MNRRRIPISSNNRVPNYRAKECSLPPPCCAFNGDPPAKEDRRLVNWHCWLADRQRLEQRLGRPPQDLQLNAHERVRTRNETKCLVEAAGRPEVTNQDRLRGNPAFWKTAPSLRSSGDGLHAQMDRSAMNLPPDVTRVALPELIVKEKGLVDPHLEGSEIGYLRSKWESGDYLRQRKTELDAELQSFEPKKPEIGVLSVVGKHFGCGDHKTTLIRTPVITITAPEKNKRLLVNPDNRLLLKIQDREFALENGRHFEKLSLEKSLDLQEIHNDLNEKKYAYCVFDTKHVYRIVPKKTKPIIWSLNFHSTADELCERIFVLENKGVQTIRIDWRNVTPEFIPLPIGPRFNERRFFFNSNRQTIVPGQRVELPIWFRSERPIVAFETWTILVEPKVYPETLTLRLWATSSGEKRKLREQEDSRAMKCYLMRRVRDTEIRLILEDILLAVTNRQDADDVPYELYFLESEIFEARNPTYFYHCTHVEQLKTMYEDTLPAGEPKTWNLCLKDLRSNLRKIEDANARRAAFAHFRQLCDWCLCRSYIYDRPTRPKHRMAYWLLCTFFNEFEVLSDFVFNQFCTTIHHPRNEEEEAENDEPEYEVVLSGDDLLVYREVFYVKIHCLLCTTVNRICAVIDSHDYFNKESTL